MAKSLLNKSGFTLIELLVVISIIALLLSILMPALSMVKEQGRVIVCKSNLKTLATANSVYANQANDWYVAAIDSSGLPNNTDTLTWNSNASFREVIGQRHYTDQEVARAIADGGYDPRFQTPDQFLCPTDKSARKAQVGTSQYQNLISYGYNWTDWSFESTKSITWGGDIPPGLVGRMKTTDIQRPIEKLMFIDAGDFWASRSGADYITYWDNYQHDLQGYRNAGQWQPTFYRHREAANIAFFDGHVEKRDKEDVFYYLPAGTTDDRKTNKLWFLIPSHFINL